MSFFKSLDLLEAKSLDPIMTLPFLFDMINALKLESNAMAKYLALCLFARRDWSEVEYTFVDYDEASIRKSLLRVMETFCKSSGGASFIAFLDKLEREFKLCFNTDEPGYLPISLIQFIQKDVTLNKEFQRFQFSLIRNDSTATDAMSSSPSPAISSTNGKKELEADILRTIKLRIELNRSVTENDSLLKKLIDIERYLVDLFSVGAFCDLELTCNTFLEFFLAHQDDLPPFIIPRFISTLPLHAHSDSTGAVPIGSISNDNSLFPPQLEPVDGMAIP
jgi:hypothetical protein